MSIKTRMAVWLGTLLAVLLLALAWHGQVAAVALARARDAEQQARTQLLGHWIDAAGRALPRFTEETAQDSELGSRLAEAAVPANLLVRRLAEAGLHSLWVLRGDGTPIVAAAADATATPPPPPLAPADFAALVRETPAPRFFAEAPDGLLEVSVRRIQGTAAAWLAVARRWDDAHLRQLAALAEARLALRPASAGPPPGDPAARLERVLPDWQGHPLRLLVAEATADPVAAELADAGRPVLIFLAFGLCLIGATAAALHRWVVHPLACLGDSLAADDPSRLAPLAADPGEFGRLARLARDSFEQRRLLREEIAQRTRAQAALAESEAALRRNLDERARLGRDLHDGVIQSLYAAGMGLAGIRPLLQAGQEEIAARLEQNRALLNETIHDVRNFIIGLEPEALRLQTFSEAISALLEVMRSHRNFTPRVEIDDYLARRLTLAQRVHALQITREATSNALRHGTADHVTVTLRRAGDFVEFEVVDDGRGFDPAATAARGSGLVGFEQRARELGAELTLDSAPGRGTRVRLLFSLLLP
ncbi:MAG: hypothetical protein HZC55_06110 [Verrucomicrobia bacterium]|nr:hypothetical protein [Verrucomicrobiota bacterium]